MKRDKNIGRDIVRAWRDFLYLLEHPLKNEKEESKEMMVQRKRTIKSIRYLLQKYMERGAEVGLE